MCSSDLNANSATNIAGGLVGSIPYQTAVNKTALLPKGTAGQVLKMGSSNIPEWGTDNNTVYSHPSDGGGSIATDLSGATVVSKIVVNSAGHVTGTNTRTLTLANLGYTGATNANYFTYSHPSGDGNLHVPATSTTNNNKFLMAGSSAGSLSWGTPTNTTYSAGTGLSLSGTSFSVKYGTTAGTAAQGNDSRLSDARTPTAHTHTFASLTSKPTTVSGFGITDAMTTSHVANGITSTNISNWGTAYTKAHDSGSTFYI